jgi:hypothetical protein
MALAKRRNIVAFCRTVFKRSSIGLREKGCPFRPALSHCHRAAKGPKIENTMSTL